MKDYVVGFMFNEKRDGVVLIEKKKPVWQAGLLNGVGGSIERLELPREAMIREWEEETGTQHKNWQAFARLTVPNHARVYFSRAFDDGCFLRAATQPTLAHEPERIVRLALDVLAYSGTIPNLRWLIPMALSMDADRADAFEIEEAYK